MGVTLRQRKATIKMKKKNKKYPFKLNIKRSLGRWNRLISKIKKDLEVNSFNAIPTNK